MNFYSQCSLFLQDIKKRCCFFYIAIYKSTTNAISYSNTAQSYIKYISLFSLYNKGSNHLYLMEPRYYH